ncbi:MAG: ATP-grasp domain-containing protein [Candidatus Aenigmarchaeota archaeon]|nr:ATP-grasp domain-containing protein [Candidatus Aenigmarchaeota archaeon]
MKNEIRIILTSVGGLVSPGIMSGLRSNEKCKFRIIGTDMEKCAVGFLMADSHYVVPPGSEETLFVEKMLEIAKKERADIIIPMSDEEVLTVSKNKKIFEENGVKCLCNNYETTRKCIDKGLLMDFLKSNGVETPRFFLPKSVSELSDAAHQLGYPDESVILKPRIGRGTRGVWLLKENFSDEIFKYRGELKLITLDGMIKQLENLRHIGNFMLMEYLPGEEFSVDTLSEKGNPLYILPRKRIKTVTGVSQSALIENNEIVSRYVTEISRVLSFDSNFNVQLKYSRSQKLLVYEINPRVSGTIVANKAAGIDLLLLGILKELNEDVPRNLNFKSVRMLRYWAESFIDDV